jgi:hypothetical protein
MNKKVEQPTHPLYYPNKKIYGSFWILEKNEWMYNQTYKFTTSTSQGQQFPNYMPYSEIKKIVIMDVSGFYRLTSFEGVTLLESFELNNKAGAKNLNLNDFTIEYNIADQPQQLYLHDIYVPITMSNIPNIPALETVTALIKNKKNGIEYHTLKVDINGKIMYAYAMPPIISGGYKKKKTSTKTKTQAKHTFIHGKKTYTRVIHLGKRGGKYVMLNGELVPIYKLQTSS